MLGALKFVNASSVKLNWDPSNSATLELKQGWDSSLLDLGLPQERVSSDPEQSVLRGTIYFNTTLYWSSILNSCLGGTDSLITQAAQRQSRVCLSCEEKHDLQL